MAPRADAPPCWPPVEPAGRLLAVHAHPDDETLATGALLATWAAAGAPVTVVTCTRGERGETIGDELASLENDPARLVALRQAELRAALTALGVVEHTYLDELSPGPARIEDSGMAWTTTGRGVATAGAEVSEASLVRADTRELAAALADLIRRERPTAVITYEPGGGYGHPDHIRAHQITRRALALCAPQYRPASVWWRVTPGDSHQAEVRELRHRGALTAGRGAQGPPGHRERLRLPPAPETVELPPQVRGDLPAQGGVRVAVEPVLQRVTAAMRAHRSQVQAVHLWDAADANATDALGAIASASDQSVAPDTPAPATLGQYALSNGELVAIPRYEHYLDAHVRGDR